MAVVNPVRVLHLVGVDDSGSVRVTRLSPDPRRFRYECLGNVELAALLGDERFQVATYTVGAAPNDDLRLPGVDVVVNAICDADTNGTSLRIATAVVERLDGVGVVNDPRVVAATTRDQVAERLAGLAGAIVPRTVRLQPSRAADVPVLAAAMGVRPPFLVREAGMHGGHQLVVVRGTGADDVGELERFAFDGRELYATEFVDFASPDGLYRKYRALVIGGEVHAKHLIVSRDWNVHARSRVFMAEHPELEAEEERFVEGMAPEVAAVLADAHQRIGLDYLGADFAVLDDGRVVIFEVNACFRPLVGTASESAIASHQSSTARIKAAFADLVAARGTPFGTGAPDP